MKTEIYIPDSLSPSLSIPFSVNSIQSFLRHGKHFYIAKASGKDNKQSKMNSKVLSQR
jgi:hypothetical protein